MRPVVFALVLFFVPAALAAQDPANQRQRSSGKKLRWLGIAAVAGGIGAAALGGRSEIETIVPATAATSATTVASVAGVASGLAAVVPTVTGSATGSAPLAAPGGGQTGNSTASTPNSPVSNSTVPHVQRFNVTNWKVIGPAIGAAGAGAFLTYVGHVRVKRAELSIKPTGAVQVAFKW